VLTVITGLVEPLDQRYEAPALANSRAEPPAQNVTGSGEVIEADGWSMLKTKVLLCTEQPLPLITRRK
jgi:hypothetical protein